MVIDNMLPFILTVFTCFEYVSIDHLENRLIYGQNSLTSFFSRDHFFVAAVHPCYKAALQ